MHQVNTVLEGTWLTQQDWTAYTDEQHSVWRELYDRRMRDLEGTAARAFLDGSAAIGLSRDSVPDLTQVNRRLDMLTGWGAVPVIGFIPAKEFFECLAGRRFPTTVIIRRRDQIEYIEEPDIFHDVFGHVPMHSDPVFADFLQRFGETAARAKSDRDVRRMARLFWFTVEFGLVREEGRIRLYGSGLISSAADGANALGPSCERRPFELDAVLEQPFEIDRLQDVLFVVDSFDQLFEAVEAVSMRL